MISTLLPMLIWSVALWFNDIYPFGDRTLIIYDFSDQYLPFLHEFGYRIRGGGSLLWSWSAAGGHDYLFHIAYYMASPLNLIASLFPSHMLASVLTFFIVLKAGLTGLFTAMYLRYITKTNDFLTSGFATIFALCGFALGYYHNIMWMDVVTITPLVLLGVHRLVRENKVNLYIISLALAIILNFHIAFMVCIFVAFYFIILCLKRTFKESARPLITITVCTIIAIGLTAFLTLPTFTALQNLYRQDSSSFPESFTWLNDFSHVLGNFTAFNPPDVFVHAGGGGAMLFSGMLSLMLLPIFLISRNASWKEKLGYVLLLVLLVVSTNANVLSFAWHGFTNTVGFPARFSFLVSLLLIIMAFKAYSELFETPNNLRIKTTGLTSVMILVPMALSTMLFIWYAFIDENFNNNRVLYNVIIVIVYLILFAIKFSLITIPTHSAFTLKHHLRYIKIQRKLKNTHLKPHKFCVRHTANSNTNHNSNKVKTTISFVKTILLLTIVAELTFTTITSIGVVRSTRRTTWLYYEIDELLATREIEEHDFFRTEFTRRLTWNDGLRHASGDINTISFFSSSMDGYTGRALRGFGLPTNLNRNTYHYIETSPLTNAFLGVRYLIERNNNPIGEGHFWSRGEHSGAAVILRNNYPLPLGFMVRPETKDWSGVQDWSFFEPQNLFTTQNDLFRKSTGLDGDLFEVLQLKQSEVNQDYNATSEFEFVVPYNSDLFFTTNITQYTDIFVDRIPTRNIPSNLRSINHVGSFEEGQVVRFSYYNDVPQGATIWIGVIDRDLFTQGWHIWSSQTLNLTEFRDTRIRGNITVQTDGILYTSIPNAGGNWRVFVNGEPREVTLIGETMTGVYLEEGEHQIEFRYINSSFIIGFSVSVISFIVMIAVQLKTWNRRKKHPRKFFAHFQFN